MEYKQLIREYHDNLGVKDAKSNDLRIARTDFINTLKVMYGKTKFPKKTYCEEFNETRDIDEDFADTTLITGLSTNLVDAQFQSGELVFDASGTLTYTNNLSDMDEIVIALRRIGADLVDNATISISIVNQLGESLYTEDQNLAGDGTYTFSPGLTNQCNFIVTITVDPVNDTSVNLQDLRFTFAKKYLTLPTDLIIPLRVVFTSADGREYASTEIQLSEYIAWTPFRFTNPDGNIVTITDPKERYITRENFLYDRTVGYLFLAEPSGVTLWWKPAIKGKATLVYSTLPTLNIEEGKFSNALEAFSDCLVAGATFRGFRRKLNEAVTQQNEAALSAIAISMRDYKSEFRQRQADWIEFTKSRATTVVVEPFDFLSDSEMLRL